jgi:hypothetical protein
MPIRRLALALALAALALTGCGPASSGSSALGNRVPAPACPGPDQVRLVTYSHGPSGAATEPRWRLALSIDMNDALIDAEQVHPIPRAELVRRVGTVPEVVQLYQPGADGTLEPCTARIATGYRGVGGDGFFYEEVGIELTGCPPPGPDQPRHAWAILAPEPMERCAVVAAEAAELTPAVKSIVPAPPSKDRYKFEYRLLAVLAGEKPVAYQLVTTYLREPVPDESCEVDATDSQDLFIATRLGPQAVSLPDEPYLTQGELDAALVAGDQLRMLMTVAVGKYLLIPVTDDAVSGVPDEHHWMIPHDEDQYRFSLAPYCGP